MGSLDTSALDPGSLKTIRDFQIKNAAENNAIKAGNIDNANKANLYRTQMLTAAVASGNQGMYDTAKAKLAEAGIDVSDLAPDIATGAQQVNAARQAQYSSNPLNAMLGLGLRAEGNLNSAAGTLGSTGAAAAANPISSSVASRMGGLVNSAPMPAPAVNPSGVVPAAGGAGMALPNNGKSAQGAPQLDMSDLERMLNGNQSSVAAPVAAPAPAANLAQNGALDANGSTATNFVQPPDVQGETQAAKQSRIQNAFNVWKENPAVVREQARSSKLGSGIGEEAANDETTLKSLDANLPNLLQVAQDLSQLGKTATYTMVGKGRDNVIRETGMDSTDAMNSRAAYIAKVDNEVLPLLRTTFGAQFTEKEGESLKHTLGAPDMSSGEKDAVLRSFIEGKVGQLQSLQRKTGKPVTDPAAGSSLVPEATAKTIAKIPAGAVQALQKNPDKAAEFDQKFGAGAAKLLLGR